MKQNNTDWESLYEMARVIADGKADGKLLGAAREGATLAAHIAPGR